jgi:YD repeat-containing protein
VTTSFTVAPSAHAPYYIVVANGEPDGTARAKGVTIWVNGTEVVTPKQVYLQVASFTTSVTVTATTTLKVKVDRATGAHIYVRFTATDNAPPVLTITAPAANAITRDTAVVVTGTVQDQTAVQVTVNGAPATVSGTSFSGTAQLPVEGTHTIHVVATDAAGLTTDSIRTVIRDTQAPVLTVNTPADGLITKQTSVTVSGTVTDATPVTVNVNGIPLPVDGAGHSSKIAFAYDTAGRAAAVMFAYGSLTFGYSSATGDPAAIRTPSGDSLQVQYDGPVPTQMRWSGAVTGTGAVSYSQDLRVAAQTVNGMSEVTFSYDRDGLLASAGALVLGRSAANGLLLADTLGRVHSAYAYTSRGELRSHEVADNGTTLYAAAYTSDSLGRLTEVVQAVEGDTTTFSYSYSGAGRLVEVRTNGVTTAVYDYDDNGPAPGSKCWARRSKRTVSTTAATPARHRASPPFGRSPHRIRVSPIGTALTSGKECLSTLGVAPTRICVLRCGRPTGRRWRGRRRRELEVGRRCLRSPITQSIRR